jgi:regulatory factor X
MDAQERIRQLYALNPAGLPAAAENSTLRLPDINEYLPENTDIDVADALTALYRSHCISVIDSFRFCREKIMFRHFTAFQGTLTVPVHKLLVHPNIAPWVEECDWLMYQKMVAFVAPLYTQMIPGPVIKAFRNISQRLVPHITETFKSHPEHVSVARVIPAGLFCRLLSRMLDANHAVNTASVWLSSIETRTLMWEDFSKSVDMADILSKSAICWNCQEPGVLKIMEERFPLLLLPLRNEPPKPQPFEHGNGIPSFPSPPDQYDEFPDRWVELILELPAMFPKCTPHLMIDKIELLWTNTLHRLTLSNSQSFTAWWMAKVFFIETFHWQAEAGGFLSATPRSLRLLDPSQQSTGRRQTECPRNRAGETANSSSGAPPNEQHPQTTDAMDITTDTPSGGPTGASLPDNNNSLNAQQPVESGGTERHMKDRTPNHDDSAIDLDDDSMLLSTGKFRDIMASDPADAEGDVVVV